LPVRMVNLSSIWTVCYTQPSRYNWMLQYYLRAEGLMLSWIGTGRLIFSLNYSDADFGAVADRFVAAASAMQRDGWWWHDPAASNRTIRRAVLKVIIVPVVAADARIDQLAPQKRKRRLVVKLDVVKRIGEDFSCPNETGLNVL